MPTVEEQKPIEFKGQIQSDTSQAAGLFRQVDVVIDFDIRDPLDPLNWPRWRKWTIISLVSLLSASIQLATLIVAPVVSQIQHEFDSDSATYATLLVTIWELGELFGPLAYGPLSEYFGRLPVMHTTNGLFVAFSVGCALSPSISVLIAMRFLSGMSVAVISVEGGIMGDMFEKKDRALALSLMMIGAQIGPALGPIIGSYLGEAKGWRWDFWLTTMLTGTISCVFAAFYRETYRVKILRRKALAVRRKTGNSKVVSKYDQQNGPRWRSLGRAIFRPGYLLARSWVLVGVTTYVSIMLGLFYLVFTTIAPAFQGIYKFSEGQSGLAYLGQYIGVMLGCVWYNVASRKSRIRNTTSDNSDQNEVTEPEHRLVPSTMAGFLTAAGFLLFGWTLAYRVHWIAPILGTTLVGLGYFVTTVSVRAYIIDAFGIYAVSATGAMLAVRNAVGAAVPLLGPPLFRRLGDGWGSTVLAAIALLIVPIPIGFIRYGAVLRQRSSLSISD